EAGRRTVRRKSLRSFKDRVRQRTRRTGGQSLQSVIDTLNPMLRGWFKYFKHAHVYTFRALGGFIRRRLRSILRHHAHRPGRGLTPENHRRSSNAYIVERGLFPLSLAHALERQRRSRAPLTGEPYAGEPPVRFGGRGAAILLPDPYRQKRRAPFAPKPGLRPSPERRRWVAHFPRTVVSLCRATERVCALRAMKPRRGLRSSKLTMPSVSSCKGATSF